MPRTLAALLPLLLVPAAAPPLCAGDPGLQCPPEGTPLRWEGYGLDFFNRHCNECHTWTDYTFLYRTRLTILDIVKTGAMPPIEHLSPLEISSFEEWVACDMPYDGPPCPPRGTYLSYDTFAAGFFEQSCSTCHAKDLEGIDRNGAPPGQDWDDYGAVAKYAIPIRDQVLKGKMPPDGAFVLLSDIDALVQWISCGAPEHPAGTLFRRADANDDGEADITDAVVVLSYLFRGEEDVGCLDAADTDGSGGLEITDAVYLLRYLFLDGPPPPPPFDACGGLPALGCERFRGCPGN